MVQREQAYQERSIEVILGQSRHLDRLITDLLDVARLEAGRLELNRARVDLLAAAETAAERAQAMTASHTARVESPLGPLSGFWDPDRLQQIFENLLSNAIKYSEDGEIVIRVQDHRDHAEVSITDQGMGVAPEVLPHLFGRFYRTELAKASREPGLGLGLYITRSLVEAHGGRISVESTPGKGSTFRFTLPYGRLGPA
jgi:signal transduction histidine kinase